MVEKTNMFNMFDINNKSIGRECLEHFNIYFKEFYIRIYGNMNCKIKLKERKKLIYSIYKNKKDKNQDHNYIVILDIMIKNKIIEDSKIEIEKIKREKEIDLHTLQNTFLMLSEEINNKIYTYYRPKQKYVKEIEIISSKIDKNLNTEINPFSDFYLNFYRKQMKPEYHKETYYGSLYDKILLNIYIKYDTIKLMKTENSECTNWYNDSISEDYFFLCLKHSSGDF